MSVTEVENRLTMLNERNEGEDETEMRERLKVMERTRHLLVWHDLSRVANHSHLVFMATCLYDQATFYNNSEYEAITGKKVNIQSLVEAPSLYIVARSSSCDEDQLCYIETRLDCLEELSDPTTTTTGVPVADKMRFFHGDSPSRQYEAGQLKGGNFYCAVCVPMLIGCMNLITCFVAHMYHWRIDNSWCLKVHMIKQILWQSQINLSMD